MLTIMETVQEPRKKQLAAAVTEAEKDAAELAVKIDGMGSVSEALRIRTVTELIDRGNELLERLKSMGEAVV